MEELKEKLRHHSLHVTEKGEHCTGEETTKQVLILPLLDILGFSPYDPLKVKTEYYADLPGVKRSERVDYALFVDTTPVMYVEVKSFKEDLGNHAPQLARYFNATPGVRVTALTNGRIWKFFTDLKHENVMDHEPFFTVDFCDLKDSDTEELARFRYGTICADNLRSFAEDQLYLAKFKQVIQTSLRDVDPDFVKYVVTKSLPTTRVTQKLIESWTQLVKKAVSDAMTGMVVSSLTTPIPDLNKPDQDADEVNPFNQNIVTTQEEKRLLVIAQDLLKHKVNANDLVAKDNENYYSLLYQGKNNRWLVRYNVNRKKPVIYFCIKLSPQHELEIRRAGLEFGTNGAIYLESPEHLYRLSGLLFDALEYCINDENFKRHNTEAQTSNSPA